MAEALGELVNVLHSKNGIEKITKQEADTLMGCKDQVVKSLAVGGSIATGLVWVATRRLNTFLRVNLAGGAGFITGMWRANESVNSCVNQILGMEGSRIQHELRQIVLQKFAHQPDKMRKFSNHFYTEEVFSDSTAGPPKSVYRQKNFYMDNDILVNRSIADRSDSIRKGVHQQQKNNVPISSNLRRSATDSRQVHLTPIDFGYEDPFKILFEYSSNNEESPQPSSSSVIARVQSHSQRRARRRRRMRQHREEPLLS